MKKVTLLLTFLTILAATTVESFASDAPSFSTYRTKGKYDAGDIVVRDCKILKGSCGPFSNLTGINPGIDPVLDPTNWCYLPQGGCGAAVTGINPPGYVSGGASGVAIPVNGNFCMPLDGLGTTVIPLSSIAIYGCTGGSATNLNTQLSSVKYTMTIDVSPQVPADTSQVHVSFFDAQVWSAHGGAAGDYNCDLVAATSCSVTVDFTTEPIWSVGDTVLVSLIFSPHISSLSQVNFTSVKWTLSPQ